MKIYKERVKETVTFLKKKLINMPEIFSNPPQIAFLTGTGLENSTASMDVTATFKYQDIPNFPIATVASHRGELIFGTLCNKKIIVMQGRFHLYEGYSPLEVTFPIRVMQELGVQFLIISNASGGLNLNFAVGDVMVINDHINLTGHNPLIGSNVESWGIRFPDMTEVYDKQLAKLALSVPSKPPEDLPTNSSPLNIYDPPLNTYNPPLNIYDPPLNIYNPPLNIYNPPLNISVRQGVYAGLLGPSLETPAETRFLKTIGADAVGFSTVMEAIAGVHAGMKILGLATITNINNPDAPEKATVEAIINGANQASNHVHTILKNVLEKIA